MTSISDSLVFRDIFSTPEVSSIWSDQARTQYYLDFEAKLALVEGRRGIIPQEAANVIQANCHVRLMDMQYLGEETTRIGYPVLPVVKELVRLANEDKPGLQLGEWAHWGATTQVRTIYVCRTLVSYWFDC